MPNPWEPPLFPDHGDNDNKTLFESIGRALTAWEDLESFLSHLYAGLSEQSLYNQEAIYRYGSFCNVSIRARDLRASGEAYFIKYPNQHLEGELSWIIKSFSGWSQRRNDVAHGVVRLIDIAKYTRISLMGASTSWCLAPPHFKEEKHFATNTPARILTSVEINRFSDAYWSLLRRVFALSQAVELPIYASQRKLVVPPLLLG